jgi:hypothetical protein
MSVTQRFGIGNKVCVAFQDTIMFRRRYVCFPRRQSQAILVFDMFWTPRDATR